MGETGGWGGELWAKPANGPTSWAKPASPRLFPNPHDLEIRPAKKKLDAIKEEVGTGDQRGERLWVGSVRSFGLGDSGSGTDYYSVPR